MDSTVVLERALAEQGLYPAVDPLQSMSNALTPLIVGQKHYDVARQVVETLQRYKELKDIIAILGLDELSDDDRALVLRARKVQKFLTQNVHVAEQFTGSKGVYVKLSDTVEGFERILSGEFDSYPEDVFYMKGTIAEVIEAYQNLES